MNKKKEKKVLYVGGGVVALLITALFAAVTLFSSSTPVVAAEATLYKTSSCGCCGVYSSYLEGKGITLTLVDLPDIASKKDEAGVPPQLRSCHTTIIDGYFIEGHVPIEAIEKLLSERPDIKGIALPGMPSGTPGMPGPKQGAWRVYAIGKDGSISTFMTI